MEILEASLTSKFQLTLPKRIRELFDLNIGDKVAFLLEGKEVLLIPKPDDFINALAKLSEGKSFPEVRKEISRMRKEW